MFITVMVSMFRFFQALESFFLRDRGRIGIEGCPSRGGPRRLSFNQILVTFPQLPHRVRNDSNKTKVIYVKPNA